MGIVLLVMAGASVLFAQFRAQPPSHYFADPKVAALADAAARGNVRTIDQLVKDGVDVNATGIEGWTPLAYALIRHNKRGFERLLELGANPNHVGAGVPFGGTVMTGAAQINDLFWLRTAMRYGGDVNVRGTNANRTPIWHAMLAKRFTNLKFLIENGADLNITDNTNSRTPLIYAFGVSYYEAAMLMLQNGADWKAEMSLLVWHNHVRVGETRVNGAVHYLTDYTNSPGPDKKSRVWQLRTEMIQMLHAQGAEFSNEVLLSAGITPEPR